MKPTSRFLFTTAKIIIATLFCNTATLTAQQQITATNGSSEIMEDYLENNRAKSAAGAFGETIESVAAPKKSAEIIPGFVRSAKPLPANFDGYAIQLVATTIKLADTDKLFTEFGGIVLEETLNPRYCYLIGTFSTEEGAEKHLKTIIGDRYPDAKVVLFKGGKRVAK